MCGFPFLKLVVEWTLVRGVARQMEAFKEGFNSVFSLANMQGLFYPSEVTTSKIVMSLHCLHEVFVCCTIDGSDDLWCSSSEVGYQRFVPYTTMNNCSSAEPL